MDVCSYVCMQSSLRDVLGEYIGLGYVQFSVSNTEYELGTKIVLADTVREVGIQSVCMGLECRVRKASLSRGIPIIHAL